MRAGTYKCDVRERDAVDPDVAFTEFVAFLSEQAAQLCSSGALARFQSQVFNRASWKLESSNAMWQAFLHSQAVLLSMRHMLGRIVDRFLSFYARNTLRDKNLVPGHQQLQTDDSRASATGAYPNSVQEPAGPTPLGATGEPAGDDGNVQEAVDSDTDLVDTDIDEHAQIEEDATGEAKLECLLGLSLEELALELNNAGVTIDTRAAGDHATLLSTAISLYNLQPFLVRLAS
mmetsp:Transcript_36751/g.93957  ORF Transcript_36751/g.93957 Transcript_36751/m.93957 type:complete len:232 (-) Transcript_36751:438-1133(-)